jgi:TRAP-type mannitol/chloroaromatic compound transport system permease large subunit
VLAAAEPPLTWSLTWQGMDTTMRITAMVVFILIGATVFSLVFQGVGGALDRAPCVAAGRADRAS